MPAYTEKYSHEVHYKRSANPDTTLPVSHTWYKAGINSYSGFQLDLPAYTCVEKAKERLRYAIRFCQSIDADKDNFETWEDYHH